MKTTFKDMDGDKFTTNIVITRNPPIGEEADNILRIWSNAVKAKNGRFPVDTYLYLSSDIIDWTTGPIDHVKK